MKTFLLTICFLSVQTGMVAIAQDKEQTPVYLDDTQPIEVRVQDALNRMTVEEKTRLSYAQGKFSSPGCPRLGIPELWMSDGPHGVRAEINWNDWGYAGWTNDSCTAFPALTCLAASWNPLLAAKYGYAIGEEARYREKDVLLGPGVNIYRTPLNGRNFEYMGEDPYLASELCVPYIQGVQKNGVAACVKHYALNDGCVITDWGAAHDTYEAAMYGLDIEMGSYTNGLTSESEFGYDDYYLGKSYLKMVREGKIPMEVVNDKAARVLRLIFRTAMNRRKPFGALTSEEHYRTAYEIATEGIVLLKNGTGKKQPALLPVPQGKYKRILVVGDNATRNLMLGGGSSELKVQKVISSLDGIKAKFGDGVVYAQGYTSGRPMYGRADVIPQVTVDSLRNDAVEKAMNSDLVIFVGGLNKNHFQDCEGGDRLSYELPFAQNELIEALLKVNKNLVAVIVSGNAVEMPWVKEIPSIVQSWYLGSVGGEALADVLSGEVTPSGKLPFSYPVKLEDCPAHFFGEISYPGDSIRQEYKEDILVGGV